MKKALDALAKGASLEEAAKAAKVSVSKAAQAWHDSPRTDPVVDEAAKVIVTGRPTAYPSPEVRAVLGSRFQDVGENP